MTFYGSSFGAGKNSLNIKYKNPCLKVVFFSNNHLAANYIKDVKGGSTESSLGCLKGLYHIVGVKSGGTNLL